MGILKCCVGGCNATSLTNRLFVFPKNDYLSRLWLFFLVPTNPFLIGLSKDQLLKKRVCDRHFDKYQYDAEGKRLRYSYPCLFSEKEIAHGVPLCVTEWSVSQEHNYVKEEDEEDMAEPSSEIIATGCADAFEHNYFKEQVCNKFTESGMADPKNEKNSVPSPADLEIGGADEIESEAQTGCAEDDIVPPSEPHTLHLHTARICRVCLALDVKMFPLRDSELTIMFHTITGIQLEDNEGGNVGSLICWECAARLRAASTFRSKALLSDTLLQRLINKGEEIEHEYFETVKEGADRLVSPKTLTATEIVHIVDIDDQNNTSQLVQSGDDDQHSILENSDTQESIIDENIQMDVEGDDNVTISKLNEIDSLCCNVEDENLIEVLDPQFTLLDVGPAPFQSELTNSQDDCDDQIIKTFLESITKSKIVPEQNVELKITYKRRKEAVGNDSADYLKENSEDGNTKKKLKRYEGTRKISSKKS